MDGRTLNEIMSGGNWSLVGPAQQAFNLTQQRSLQDLVNSQGQEQRAQSQEQRLQQMHPVEMSSKQSYANQAQAQADTMQEHLKVLQGVPLDQRIAVGVAENKKKLSDIDRQRLDGEMSDLSKLAAAAVQNGGTLPLGMNVSNPEHAKLFGNPQGAALAAQIAKAYWMSTPEELGKAANDERDSKRAIELARIMAQSRENAAAGKGKDTPPTTDTPSIARNLLKLKKASEKLAQLKVYWPMMSEEQRAEWVPVAEDLLTQANEEARVSTAGKVDPNAATKGRVPTTPGVNLGAPSGAAANRPARQAEQKMTAAKLQEAYPGVPLEKLKELYKKKFGVDVQ